VWSGGGFDYWCCRWVNERGFGRGNGNAPCFGTGLGSWADTVVRVDVDAAGDAAVGVDEEAHGDVEGARVCEINAAVCARCGKRCPFSLRCRRLWEIPSLLLTLETQGGMFMHSGEVFDGSGNKNRLSFPPSLSSSKACHFHPQF